MRAFIIVFATLFIASCDTDNETVRSKKAESRYSETLNHARETAGHLQQSLDRSAARRDAIQRSGE